MRINEKELKEIVLRVLQEIQKENKSTQKVFMVCTTKWDKRYCEFLNLINDFPEIQVYPVIPESWKDKDYELVLRGYKSCYGVLYRESNKPKDFDKAITVFPVLTKDIVVKTALCISDTFETSWITSCIEEGCRTVFLRTGLMKFSGKESQVYVNQILSYYRRVLEYGIEINEGSNIPLNNKNKVSLNEIYKQEKNILSPKTNKKQVIAASNIEQYGSNGTVYLKPGDIVTDLAKDRAKFLNITFKYTK